MSWDLEFVPPEAAPDVLEWLEEEHAEDLARARAHGEAVKRAVPELELYDSQLVSGDDAVPLTVDLFGTQATVNVAYWPGTTETAAPVVGRVARALADAGSFLVFDPQAGELIQPDEVEAAFRREHPRGAKVAARISRPLYRRLWAPLSTAAVIALVLHRTGVF